MKEIDTSDGESKQKKDYAVQLCLYSEILIGIGISNEKRAYIIDISGSKIEYNLELPINARTTYTYWEYYLDIKKKVSALIENKEQNLPAMALQNVIRHDS